MIYYISAGLVLSVSINILFIMYSRWLAARVAESQMFVEDLREMVNGFSTHLKAVNELEMFYGDETLKSLIIHSSEIVKALEEYDSLLDAEESPIPEELEVPDEAKN